MRLFSILEYTFIGLFYTLWLKLNLDSVVWLVRGIMSYIFVKPEE